MASKPCRTAGGPGPVARSDRSNPAHAGGLGAARPADLRVFALLLAVIVVVPFVGVAVLGGRMIELGPVEARSQQTQAAADALHHLSNQVSAAVDQFAVLVAERIDEAIQNAGETGPLRMIAVAHPFVDLVVIYAADGQRLFPATADSLFSPSERHLARSAFAPLKTARQLLVMEVMGDNNKTETWTLVGAPVGLSPARCWRRHDDLVVCAVLDRRQLTDAVVAALNDVGPSRADLEFALIDEAGSAIWPADAAAVGSPLVALPLRQPWTAWRLEARMTALATAAGPSWNTFIALMVAMLGAIGGLAAYIFLTQRSRLEATHRRAAEAAQISHELRTPLTNLGLYGELIRTQANGNAMITEYCDVLDAETKRLGALVEDATAIARGRAYATTHLHTGVPDEAARHTLMHYRPMLEKVGGRVQLCAKADKRVRYDRMAFERIMINFLDNARKYAPGSQIDVETWMNGESLHLAVRDYGAGVPEPIAEAIFDPLVRADGGPEGHGLGLASCRRLARVNGGDVKVEDGGPGARFVAWLRTEPGPGDP